MLFAHLDVERVLGQRLQGEVRTYNSSTGSYSVRAELSSHVEAGRDEPLKELSQQVLLVLLVEWLEGGEERLHERPPA